MAVEIKRFVNSPHCYRDLSPEESAKIVNVFIADEIVKYGGFPRAGDRVRHIANGRNVSSDATVLTVSETGGAVTVRWDKPDGEHPEGTPYSTSAFRLRAS